MIDIVSWAESQFGFYVDRHYTGGKWILEPGPIKLSEYHARILRHIFTPDPAGRWPYDIAAWCEPAKSGKSALAGLIAEYVALHGDSNSTIVMASNKREQAASLMYKSLTDSIGFNPHLPKVEPGRLSVTFRNGSEVKAIASNSKGEAGARFSLAIFDELWAYIYQDSERLWAEFKTDPTRSSSVKFAIGYGGYTGEGELWEGLLTDGITKGEAIPELADITNEDGSPCCYRYGRQFVFWSHVTRQPWQTEEWKASQRKALRPAEYSRMIETTFSEGQGDFCEPEAWQACIDPTHRPLPPGDYRPIFVGMDLATSPGGDDCALIGVYAENGRVKVAFHELWQGKHRPTRLKLTETVKPYLLRLKDSYRVIGVWFDPFQALALAEDLRKAGIPCYEVSQTHASRGPKDTALLELINNRQLCLYPHSDFTNLSSKAHAKELGNGLIFLKKASSRGKIDLLVSLANVANEVTQRRTIAGPLLQGAVSGWTGNPGRGRSEVIHTNFRDGFFRTQK